MYNFIKSFLYLFYTYFHYVMHIQIKFVQVLVEKIHNVVLQIFLTTYHNCPNGQVPGKLFIQTPIGNILEFSFTSYCPMSGFYGPGPDSSPSDGCSNELSNKCGNVNSEITCYYKPDGVNMIPAKNNDICLAGNTQLYNCAYYASINNAVTGNYIVGLQKLT